MTAVKEAACSSSSEGGKNASVEVLAPTSASEALTSALEKEELYQRRRRQGQERKIPHTICLVSEAKEDKDGHVHSDCIESDEELTADHEIAADHEIVGVVRYEEPKQLAMPVGSTKSEKDNAVNLIQVSTGTEASASRSSDNDLSPSPTKEPPSTPSTFGASEEDSHQCSTLSTPNADEAVKENSPEREVYTSKSEPKLKRRLHKKWLRSLRIFRSSAKIRNQSVPVRKTEKGVPVNEHHPTPNVLATDDPNSGEAGLGGPTPTTVVGAAVSTPQRTRAIKHEKPANEACDVAPDSLKKNKQPQEKVRSEQNMAGALEASRTMMKIEAVCAKAAEDSVNEFGGTPQEGYSTFFSLEEQLHPHPVIHFLRRTEMCRHRDMKKTRRQESANATAPVTGESSVLSVDIGDRKGDKFRESSYDGEENSSTSALSQDDMSNTECDDGSSIQDNANVKASQIWQTLTCGMESTNVCTIPLGQETDEESVESIPLVVIFSEALLPQEDMEPIPSFAESFVTDYCEGSLASLETNTLADTVTDCSEALAEVHLTVVENQS